MSRESLRSCRHRRRHSASPWASLFLLALTVGGCAALRQENDAFTRYERTRDELQRAARGESREPALDADNGAQGLSLDDFSPDNVKGTVSKMVGRGPKPEEAERLYSEANAVYNEALELREQKQPEAATEKFLAAASIFLAAGKKLPKSSVEQNSLFFAGESYFFADRYVKANDQYERLLKEFPNSRHLDEVQRRRFAIAQFWLENYQKELPAFYEVNLTDPTKPKNAWFTNAMKVFDRIRLDDPTGKLADDATLALANAHFADGNFTKADEYYTDLRRTFPSSEHQFTAHFVGLKAKLLTYQGPDYGGTVLDECEKLIHTIRKQFPVEAEKERDYLVRALAEVRYRKAEREFLTAEYFRAKAEYGAARYYYNIILQDFEDTKFAEESRAHVAEIQGLPDVPPQRFSWLVDAFPREENVRPLMGTDRPKTKKR